MIEWIDINYKLPPINENLNNSVQPILIFIKDKKCNPRYLFAYLWEKYVYEKNENSPIELEFIPTDNYNGTLEGESTKFSLDEISHWAYIDYPK